MVALPSTEMGRLWEDWVGGVETRRVEEVIGNLGLQYRSENKAEVAHVGSSVHGQCLKSQGG